MKKFWIFMTFLAVACGTWAVLFRTNLMPEQKETVNKFIQDIMPGRRKGFIRGIVSSEESFTALIDDLTVREGDTIHGVKIIKIYADKVEFEKNGRQWAQGLNETPSRQWYVDTEARARAKAQAEAGAKAKAERVFESRLEKGTWTPEAAVNPEPGIDQVRPSVRRRAGGKPVISWDQEGERIVFDDQDGGKRSLRRATPITLTGVNAPEPLHMIWLLKKSTGGEWELYRYQYRHLRPAHPAIKVGDRGATATSYYIGYGDSITYGHDSGGDISRWYASPLITYLESAHPGHGYYFYNEGYPGAITQQMLYGGGAWGCPGINDIIDDHPPAKTILIMGGTNDVNHGVAYSDTKYNLEQMVDRSNNKSVEPVLGTIIPIVKNDNAFNSSSDLCNNYIIPLALEKACLLADPFHEISPYYPSDYLYEVLYGYPDHWDGVHPNWLDGDEKIAEAWFSALSDPDTILVLDSGDYDGNGASDIAIFRPASGLWSVRGFTRLYFGNSSDTPAPGDYNGDGTTDFALFRSASGLWAVRGITRIYYGAAGDKPAPGDYDGDGCCNIAVFRESTSFWAARGVTKCYFGKVGDQPVPGYYQGGHEKDIGVFRSSNGLWALRGLTRIYFGSSGDHPVPADYNNDGSWQAGIYRSSSSLWAIRDFSKTYYGTNIDRPVPGAYSGGGAEIAIFRENTGLWAIRNYTRVCYGASGDIPVTR